MYACEDVEVRTCLFDRVNQMVRHVGANASVPVYPPDRNKEGSTTISVTTHIGPRNEPGPFLSRRDSSNGHAEKTHYSNQSQN
jgi:hypothetical protein